MRLLSPWYLLFLLAVPPLVWLSLRTMKLRSPAAGEAAPGEDAGLTKGRRTLFLIMRITALVLLVLALAGPAVSRVARGVSIAFLLDESESVTDANRERAMTMIESIRSHLGREDRALLVRFGGNAEAEELAPGRPASLEAGDEVDRGSTDIAGAVQFTLAQLPEEGTRKIILFTDGNENRGKATEAAALARSFGVTMYTVPLAPSPSESEVSVESILAPDKVRSGEPHQVTVLIKSRTRTSGRVSVLRDGEPIGVKEGILEPGENSITIKSSLTTSGVHSYEAFVEAADDQFLENNHFKRFIRVEGAPAVLYVSKRGERSSALLAALAAQGITAVECGPAEIPGALEGFVPYDGVILDNVPGFSLSYEKMQTIEQYVRDVGGGLLMIGGDTSFGAGGYYKTPIERILPVDMDVKSQVQMPRLTLVIMADKSGSMSGLVPSGETKLDVVKSAAYEAVQLLNPFDKVGLLAFDADWEWTVPLTDAGNKDEVSRQLSMLTPGGGTVMFGALQEAHRVVAGTTSATKHVIIISDGLSETGDFEAEVKAMMADKITVSTVAVGEDADRELLSKMALLGGGRFYATNDPTTVPRIFVTETMLVSRGLLVEKRFLPVVSSQTEILRGIPLADMPPLDGFVFTYLKNGAEESLRALYDAPLLASWRYGLGKAAAFTSDLKGRWGKAWTGWGGYGRFTSQLVRWIQRPVSFDVMHPTIRLAAGTGKITVDAYDELSAFVNGMDLRAVILGPGEERQEVRLPQKAPGLYEGTFSAEKMGDYSVTLAAVNRSDLAPRTIGVSLSYPEEYRDIGVNTELLSTMASTAGGRMLALTDDVGSGEGGTPAPAYADIFLRDSRRVVESSPLWPLLVALALIAFFIDIAARKLVLSRSMRERLASVFRRRGPKEDYSYQDLSRMVSSAKEEERRKLREKVVRAGSSGKVDPDLAAYLYIARLKGKTREK